MKQFVFEALRNERPIMMNIDQPGRPAILLNGPVQQVCAQIERSIKAAGERHRSCSVRPRPHLAGERDLTQARRCAPGSCVWRSLEWRAKFRSQLGGRNASQLMSGASRVGGGGGRLSRGRENSGAGAKIVY